MHLKTFSDKNTVHGRKEWVWNHIDLEKQIGAESQNLKLGCFYVDFCYSV